MSRNNLKEAISLTNRRLARARPPINMMKSQESVRVEPRIWMMAVLLRDQEWVSLIKMKFLSNQELMKLSNRNKYQLKALESVKVNRVRNSFSKNRRWVNLNYKRRALLILQKFRKISKSTNRAKLINQGLVKIGKMNLVGIMKDQEYQELEINLVWAKIHFTGMR